MQNICTTSNNEKVGHTFDHDDDDEDVLHTIELDCAPGYPRPCDLLPQILEGTNLFIDPENTVSRMYGNWEWAIPKEQSENFMRVRPLIEERIRDLYKNGKIRYGSW